jgi:hypothetical protein
VKYPRYQANLLFQALDGPQDQVCLVDISGFKDHDGRFKPYHEDYKLQRKTL